MSEKKMTLADHDQIIALQIKNMSLEDAIFNVAYERGKREAKGALLPANDAVQNWFEENIDKDCSASSAVYKFRQWLEELQVKRQPGPVWVKASTRLPEVDGYYCIKEPNGRFIGGYINTGENGNRWVSDSDGFTVTNWKSCEWLDESATPSESPAEQPVREVDKEIIEAQAEYIQLLGDELNEVVGLVATRDYWRSTRVEQGKQLREKIDNLYALKQQKPGSGEKEDEK